MYDFPNFRFIIGALNRSLAFLIFFALMPLLAPSPVQAAVLRVDTASTASTPDGSTWAKAFKTIQAAVDAAATGDEIWVTKGTYMVDSGDQVVLLKTEVFVYGGFAGTESTRTQRNWTANTTIIDGQSARRCVKADDTSLIDGFTLQTGKANDSYGGGMFGGTANNCIFTGNQAVDQITLAGLRESFGGGMYSGTAINCTFSGNSAYLGGGMYQCIAISCTFTGNSALLSGGGMYGGTATNCVFTKNSAGSGGGMYSGTASNCTFSGNSAKNGGGMYYGTITNCIIWGNNPNEVYETDVTFSCLPLDSPAHTGTGNIFGDPKFINPWTGDFRLQTNSPCVDAGTTAGTPATDVVGRSRPQGTGVDMGAFEHIPQDDADIVPPGGPLRVNVASTAATPDGLTWATAYPTLQAAADRAGYGVEIWVVKGTYTVAAGDQAVLLKPGTFIYGGFAGTESSRDQRNWIANATVIDGQDARGCITADGASAIDGFIVQNGMADYGGGMDGGTAINCTFSGNSANHDGGGMNGGTAINCAFSGNSADHGGGMCYGTVSNCTFSGNSANYGGGGMWYGTAINCTFSGNSADDGGGMYYGTASNCTFSGNSTNSEGGGMYYGTANNCIFSGNSANYDGGGMNGSTAINCTFSGNSAGRGGGINHGTAINCTFSGNSAGRGGGINDGTAINCIIWGNGTDEIKATDVTFSCLSLSNEGGGNIVGNPGFMNAASGDFRLRADSPCIDAGRSGTEIPTNDILGVARPQGTGFDMGAYEYVSPVVTPNVVGQTQAAADATLTGANLSTGAVTEQCSNSITAGVIISQTPAAGQQIAYGGSVALVVSSGPCNTEGEGEPTTPPAINDMRARLTDGFDGADTNGDGQLTYGEAAAIVSEMTQEIFAQLDTNGDGVLDKEELGSPVDEEEKSGCGCKKSDFSPQGMKKYFGDLFLAGLALGVLMVIRHR